MIIIICIAVLAVIAIGLLIYENATYNLPEWLVSVITPIAYIGGAIAVIMLLIAPLAQETDRKIVIEYNVVKQVLEESRGNPDTAIERATVTQKIIEINTKIAKAKYWNGTIWDIYWLDELAELEPLK